MAVQGDFENNDLWLIYDATSGGGGVSIGDAIGGAANNQILITDGAGNLSEIPNIINTGGGGSLFLADDGIYKTAPTSISIGDTISGGFPDKLLFMNNFGELQISTKLIFDGESLNFTGYSSSSTTSTSFGLKAGLGNASIGLTSVGHLSHENSIGTYKTALGFESGNLSDGFRMVSIGAFSNKNAASGGNNVAVGYSAAQSINGGNNVAIGGNAMEGSIGQTNIGIGNSSGQFRSGDYNISMGSQSSDQAVGTGNLNIGINSGALQNGNNNVGLGFSSLLFCTGSENTVVGFEAGAFNNADRVLALGYQAGSSNSFSNVTIIGFDNLPQFATPALAAAGLPAASSQGIYLYWDTSDDTIKARP